MNVEEQLRRTLDDAAHRLPERPGDVTMALAEGDRRRRRTRAGAVAAGVTVVAVAAIGFTVADWPGSGSFPIDPVDQDVAEQPPNEEGPEGNALPAGQPVLTMTAGNGWAVLVSQGAGDRWCVTVRRGGADLPVPAGETCDEIAGPAQGGAEEVLSPIRSQPQEEAELLFGAADRGVDDVAVTFRDGASQTATVATGGGLPFLVWALPLDGRTPVRVEALRAGEVIGARDLENRTGAGPTATAADEALIADLLRFATDPTGADAVVLPLSDQVALGLADEIIVTRDADELADPEKWWLDMEQFRAYVGPFSALDLAAGSDPADTVVSVGEHPHCASPPQAGPEGFDASRRVSVQPDPDTITSCLEWWTVDLYLDAGGRIAAVTLDLYEP